MPQSEDGVYVAEIQACVLSVYYDFCAQQGVLVMIDGNCCDMTGCIAFFSRIDPSVRIIVTGDGGQRSVDVIYFRDDKGNWKCKVPKPKSLFLSGVTVKQ